MGTPLHTLQLRQHPTSTQQSTHQPTERDAWKKHKPSSRSDGGAQETEMHRKMIIDGTRGFSEETTFADMLTRCSSRLQG